MRNGLEVDAWGRPGRRIAVAGTLGFAALAPVSIALSQICIGLTALGLVLGFVFERRRYRPTGLELPLAAFLVIEVLAAISGRDRSWSLPALEDDWPLLLVPFFAQAMRDFRDVRRAFSVLLVSSAVASAYAVAQVFIGRDLVRSHGLDPVGNWYIGSGFFGHHLTWGGIVLVAATLALTLFLGAPSRRSAVLAGLTLCGLVASFARTAWVGLLAAVVALALSARGRIRAVSLGALAVGIALALTAEPVRLRLAAFITFHDDPRVRLWRTALRIWKAHPVLGSGPGAFKHLFEQYKVPGFYMATGHPHNDFLKVLVNSGVIGFAAFVVLWVAYFRRVQSARARVPARDPRGPYLLAGIVTVLAFLVAASGQCFLSDETVADLFWFFVAGTLVVAREVREESAA